MAGPLYRRFRRSLAAAASVVAVAALVTGSPAAGEVADGPFRVLQLNICGSGIAGCYTGRSVAEAAAVIRAGRPDVVTLNEVCQDDVHALGQALARGNPGGTVVREFKAAVDRPTGGPVRCRNGQEYGIGLLAQLPAPHRGYTAHSGIYPVQDARDPEERVWLCLSATAAFYACTTHLASTSSTDALAQCRHLLGTAIPAMRARGGYRPTVVGGDLNLRSGGSPDVRRCLPPGYLRSDDGAVQQVVATADFAVRSSRSIGMNGATDHPALLVSLRTAGPRRSSAGRSR